MTAPNRTGRAVAIYSDAAQLQLVKTREGLALPTAWAADVSPRSSSWEGLSPVFYDEF